MSIQKRNKEDNSYKRLQDESVEMLQRLSGKRWTDFNVHDPGVTISDITNYALLELEYLCSLPLEEYLADSTKNTGDLPAEIIFAPAIVTPNDYCNLILGSFNEINTCDISVKNSLYTIRLGVKENTDKNDIRNKVASLYHRNRNLCENLREIIVEYAGKKEERRIPKAEDISYKSLTSEPVKQFLQKGLSYHSLQYDFPDCYGIGEKGLAPNASPEHKASILQLKAYLLIFDYLLSGVYQQIRLIPQLLTLSDEIPVDFYPDVQIQDIEKLVDNEKLKKISVFDLKQKTKQKEYFFDCLDKMYGEDTSCYVKDISDPTERNAARAKLIQHLPELNTIRFRSFDLSNVEPENQSGIEQFVNLVSETLPGRNNEAFYIVEHILLTDEKQNPGEPNKLTIVFPDWIEFFQEQEIIPELFEERLPAHLEIEYIRLNPEKMAWFKRAYFTWRNAWATEGNAKIAAFSNEIKNRLYEI